MEQIDFVFTQEYVSDQGNETHFKKTFGSFGVSYFFPKDKTLG